MTNTIDGFAALATALRQVRLREPGDRHLEKRERAIALELRRRVRWQQDGAASGGAR